MVNALYNQVDEEVHELVILSNDSQKHLESLLEVCKFEEQTQQVGLTCLEHQRDRRNCREVDVNSGSGGVRFGEQEVSASEDGGMGDK